MSRIGKLPIIVPEDVNVTITGNAITAKGPKGELSVDVHPEMIISFEDGQIAVKRPSDGKIHRELHGLSRSLVSNIVEGVKTGFEKRLEIVGVGYRAEMKGIKLVLSLGYSHQIIFVPPESIEIAVEGKGNNTIIVKGIKKELVGQVAAKIRSFRPPEPYKGKGVRYANEVVRKKAGKTAK